MNGDRQLPSLAAPCWYRQTGGDEVLGLAVAAALAARRRDRRTELERAPPQRVPAGEQAVVRLSLPGADAGAERQPIHRPVHAGQRHPPDRRL
jgi:MYXO-CTERM domain-containing protein